MKKLFFYALFMLPISSIFANEMSTLGSPVKGNSLYSCVVVSYKNYYPIDGHSKTYHTMCRKVNDQNMAPDQENAIEYAPKGAIGFSKTENSFFWYRPDEMTDGSDKLKEYCKNHLDYFKDCEWTEIVDVDIDIDDIGSTSPELNEIINESVNLTDKDIYGCAVVLCLANPNGWASVSECRPPIRKLFRDLAKGKSFPTCSN